ncbi:MAG: putative two-component sensor histidine kinase protein [Actinomycetia bacterium]|nr:putative two-component sensor histidine kinase protein [Actinomycetes bacterium]
MSAQPDDLHDAGDSHLVAFYDSDGHLAEAVVRFVGQAVNGGDAALLVATADHRRQFCAALEADDIDTAGATADGRLVVLDAEATLSGFLVDGMPDRALFRGLLSGIIAQAAAGHRRVRIYGEMVALLWAWGNAPAAIALEDLWNELAADYPFALLCAYPVHEIDPGGSAAFLTVCQQHSAVLPDEHFEADPDWAERRQVILDTGSPSGDDRAAALDDGVRADFVTEIVEHLRTGIIDRGQALLADARRTIEAIDAMVMPEAVPEAAE